MAAFALLLPSEHAYTGNSSSWFSTIAIGRKCMSWYGVLADRDARIKSTENYAFGGGSKRWHLVVSHRDNDFDIEFGGHVFLPISRSSAASQNPLFFEFHRGPDRVVHGGILQIFDNVIWATRSDGGYSIKNQTGVYFDPINATTIQLQIHYSTIVLAASVLLLVPALHFQKYLKRQRRERHGECVGCGYNLTSSNKKCPECGMTKASNTTASPN